MHEEAVNATGESSSGSETEPEQDTDNYIWTAEDEIIYQDNLHIVDK